MSGAVALKADKLRWIPGQRSARYDIAGFVSLISDWPVADKGELEYKDSETGEWKTTEISLINMICTNLDYLGVKHPIYPDVKPDDGRIVLSYIDSKNSRAAVVRLGLGMKKGKFLGVQKGTTSFSVSEFKLTPTSFKSPFCIDGDPHDVSAVHVTCLNKALRLFYLDQSDTTAAGGQSVDSAEQQDEAKDKLDHKEAMEQVGVDDEDAGDNDLTTSQEADAILAQDSLGTAPTSQDSQVPKSSMSEVTASMDAADKL